MCQKPWKYGKVCQKLNKYLVRTEYREAGREHGGGVVRMCGCGCGKCPLEGFCCFLSILFWAAFLGLLFFGLLFGAFFWPAFLRIFLVHSIYWNVALGHGLGRGLFFHTKYKSLLPFFFFLGGGGAVTVFPSTACCCQKGVYGNLWISNVQKLRFSIFKLYFNLNIGRSVT